MPYVMADGTDVLENDLLEGNGLEGFSLKKLFKPLKKLGKKTKRAIAYVAAPLTGGTSLLTTKKGKKKWKAYGKYAVLAGGVVLAVPTAGATLALASSAAAAMSKSEAKQRSEEEEKKAALLSEAGMSPGTQECPEGFMAVPLEGGLAGSMT